MGTLLLVLAAVAVILAVAYVGRGILSALLGGVASPSGAVILLLLAAILIIWFCAGCARPISAGVTLRPPASSLTPDQRRP